MNFFKMNVEIRPFQICPCKDISEKIDIHEGHVR